MTTANDPDRIRMQIERTQRELSGDVDALTEKVSPGRIVQRRVGRVRGTLTGLRDAVMGSGSQPAPTQRAGQLADRASDRTSAAGSAVSDAASAAGSTVSEAASSAASTVSDAASSAAETVRRAAQEAPDAAVRQTRGNPLAAGLIAFGAGWLVSSLVPATRREQELAGQAKDAAVEAARPLAQQVGDKAREVGDNLREPAQEAVQSVRETAQESAATVADERRRATGEVQDRATDAGGTVRDEIRSG